MKPMEPMKPLEPLQPMKPMATEAPWWPAELGAPSTSGGRDDLAYAFFPERQRLAVRREGRVELYNSGDHRIDGASQDSAGETTFASQHGTVELSTLERLPLKD